MAEGRGREEWGRMSVLCAIVGNAHRDPKKGRAFKPGDFNPYEREAGTVIEVTADNIGTLKQAFIGRKGI